ncbi:MAG TPA: hypothetical protein VJA94_13035 [Candidatus Angelobacter sp.]
MKSKPETVLEELKNQQIDPNSTAVLEIIEEVAERVLRNLTPQPEPSIPLGKAKSCEL